MHNNQRIGMAMAGAIGLLPLVATAEPMATDRPDFVESSDVVGRGHVQVETELSVERHNGQRLRSTPLLLRVGVSETLELRLETDGALRSSGGGAPRETGMADASLGIKWHWRDGDDKAGTPSMALLAHVDMDSGSRAFRGQGLRPSLRAVAEWELPADISVGVMPGLVWDKAPDGRRFVGGMLAATLGKAFTSTWRGFVELAGQQIAAKKNGGNVLSFDAGLAWLASDSLQFDLALARGLNKNTPDQWGLGMSVRF